MRATPLTPSCLRADRIARMVAMAEEVLAGPLEARELRALAGACARIQAEAMAVLVTLAARPAAPARGLTAAAMASELGGAEAGWTARRLYRLRPQMPDGCAYRRGGRLLFNSACVSAWVAGR